jgi:hypothetical protein
MSVMGNGKIVTGIALGLTSARATVTTIVIDAIPILVLILLLALPHTAAAHAQALPAVGEEILGLLPGTGNAGAHALQQARLHRAVMRIRSDISPITASIDTSIGVVAIVERGRRGKRLGRKRGCVVTI